MHYIFDGTYAGYLTCVFEAFERKEFDVQLATNPVLQVSFFDVNTRDIITDSDKVARVQKGLQKRIGVPKSKEFYQAFLSEDVQVWNACFRLLLAIFKGRDDLLQNYGDEDVLLFSKTLKKVSRERHRMKAFVRFQKSADGLFFAIVEPDFNVLPLIISFFKNRYADQAWIIFDVKRKYGIHYDKVSVSEIRLTETEKGDLMEATTVIDLDDKDEYFKNLWLQYFKSTNIASRKNMKLHLQHVPKRYWRYLPEKADQLR